MTRVTVIYNEEKNKNEEIHMYVLGSPNFIQGSAPDPPGAGWAEGNTRGKNILFIAFLKNTKNIDLRRLRYVDDARRNKESHVCNNL